jgi:hypothetical protein
MKLPPNLAAFVCAAALCAGQAQAAAPANIEAWDGVWSPIENNMFDPSGGQKDPNFAREYPPYKPDWEARYVAVLAAAQAGKPTDPTASCLPGGMPRNMANPYAQEIITKPRQITILKELQTQIRRIYIDEPMPADPEPTFIGYSVGHWEGDTLVVQTAGLRGDTVFDRTGAPHSDKMTLVERMRLRSPDVWEDKITVTDPVAFTRPWVVTRTYMRRPTWKILEYVCEENNRNAPGADGVNGFIGPKAK